MPSAAMFGQCTITQAGCSHGYAIRPMTAVAAISRGLLTFQRNNTASDTSPIKSVSQSPIAMRPSRMHAENGPDRRRIGAFDESLHIEIAAMPRQHGRGDQHEQKRGEENADGRDDGAPEAGDESRRRSR